MCKMDNKKGTKNTAVRKPSKEPDATNVTANTADYIAPKIQDSHRIQVSGLFTVVFLSNSGRSFTVLWCVVTYKAKMATSFAKAEKTELAPSPPQVRITFLHLGCSRSEKISIVISHRI